MTPTDLDERIDAGVAWLDEHIPEWVTRVEPAELDMRSGAHCVLGQAYAGDSFERVSDSGYVAALRVFSRHDPYSAEAEAWAVSHGFNVADPDNDDDGFGPLTDAWLDRLSERGAS